MPRALSKGPRRSKSRSQPPTQPAGARSFFRKRPLETCSALDAPRAAELCLALLDAGADPVFDEGGRSALHIAARFGRALTVQALLDRGHSAKAASKSGWTAFLCAAMSGRIELCQELASRLNVRARERWLS